MYHRTCNTSASSSVLASRGLVHKHECLVPCMLPRWHIHHWETAQRSVSVNIWQGEWWWRRKHKRKTKGGRQWLVWYEAPQLTCSLRHSCPCQCFDWGKKTIKSIKSQSLVFLTAFLASNWPTCYSTEPCTTIPHLLRNFLCARQTWACLNECMARQIANK